MSEQRQSRLEQFIAAPRRAVWVLAAPMIAGMLVHTVYVLVDTAFIAWTGEHAMAAITIVFPLLFVLFAITNGIGTAVTALVAQAIGRGDHAEADRVAGSGLLLALIAGALLGVGGLATGEPMLRLMGARGAALGAARDYFAWLSVGVPLFFIGTTLRSILTGEGDSRTPMVIMALATVVNLGLDALLILGLGLGIRGAAVATLASQAAALAVFAHVVLVRRRTTVRVRARQLRLHGPLLRGLLTIGLPATGQQLVMAFGMALFNRVIAHFGLTAVATYGAASKVDMIVAMPIMGLAGAAVALIGMFAGAGRVDLVRSTALYTFRWAVTIAVVVGAAGYLASRPIIGIFVDSPEALAMGRTYLGYMLVAYPMMAIGISSGRIFQGLGHGVPSLVLTLLRVLLVGVPAAFVAVYLLQMPITAVWSAMVAGGACSTALAIFWLHRVIWRRDPTLRARTA